MFADHSGEKKQESRGFVMLRVASQRHITTQHTEYSIASGLFCCVWQLTGHTVVRPKLNVFVYIIHGGEQHIRSFWTASCLRWTRANNTTLTCMFTSHESGWDGNRHVAGISRVWVSDNTFILEQFLCIARMKNWKCVCFFALLTEKKKKVCKD